MGDCRRDGLYRNSAHRLFGDVDAGDARSAPGAAQAFGRGGIVDIVLLALVLGALTAIEFGIGVPHLTELRYFPGWGLVPDVYF